MKWLHRLRTRFRTSLLQQTLLLGLSTLLLLWGAVSWRDSGRVIESSDRIIHWLAGENRPWSILDAIFNFIVLVFSASAFFWVLRRLRYWLRQKNAMTHENSMSHLLSDVPPAPESDQLGRLAFAREIVSTVLTAPKQSSVVIGIEGAWGEGKTSVLDWVEAELTAQNPKPVIVRFDPWPEDSKLGVVSRLLDAISMEIERSSEVPPAIKVESAQLLRRLANSAAREAPAPYSLIAQLIAALLYGRRIGISSLASDSLSADRSRLRKCLYGLPQRLVVIADDLDRVDASELRTILLAVNALSSFPNTNVILAFDPEVVDTMLATEGLISQGATFREKIVHVSMPLPLALFSDRRAMFDRGLDQILNVRGVSDDWQLLAPALREEATVLVVQIAKSPRSMKRVINHFCALTARLRREVNGADVLLMELLRAVIPAVWSFIRTHRAEFDPHYVALDSVRTFPVRKAQPIGVPKDIGDSLLDLALQVSPLAVREDARRILLALFPDLQDSASRRHKETELRDSRVSVGANLKRYFSLGIEGGEVAISDVRAYLANTSKRDELLAAAQSRGVLAGFIAMAAKILEPGKPVDEASALCMRIVQVANEEWQARHNDICEESARLLYEVVKSLSDERRPELIEEIVKGQTSLSTSHVLLLNLLKHANLWSNGVFSSSRIDPNRYYDNQLIESSELARIKDIWVGTVWNKGLHYIFSHEPHPMAIVYRAAQLEGDGTAGYLTARAAMKELLKDNSGLLKLVSQYSSQARGMSYGVDGLEKLIDDWPEFIERVAKLNEPRDAIDKIKEYDELIHPGSG